MYYPEKNRRLGLGFYDRPSWQRLGISKTSFSWGERNNSQPESVLSCLGATCYFMSLKLPLCTNNLTEFCLKIFEEQTKSSPIVQSRFAYKVYTSVCQLVGANIYDDMDYDTVYFDKDLA